MSAIKEYRQKTLQGLVQKMYEGCDESIRNLVNIVVRGPETPLAVRISYISGRKNLKRFLLAR